jgi:putative membrane protein
MNVIDPADRFEIRPSVSDHFAWLRTRMGLESTFLAWIRTAVSLIGFGFTIVQFFERLRGMETSTGRVMNASMPRNLGLTLIAAGIGALVVSMVQYHRQMKYLWSKAFSPIAGIADKPHQTPAFVSACVLLLVGIAAFMSVFFRFM